MRESSLFSRIRPKLIKWGAVSRVENAAEPGTWDVAYTIDGVMGWLETKVEHGHLISFERFQLNWASRHHKAGAKTLFVLVARGKEKMSLYHVSEILAARRDTKGKFIVLNTSEMTPVLDMVKPFTDDWDLLRSSLMGKFT